MKRTWNRSTPSSPSSFASSPGLVAAASSQASPTVCGTIERSSCSRSHGHSRRSLRVSASRRATASPVLSSMPSRLLREVEQVVGAHEARGVAALPVGDDRRLAEVDRAVEDHEEAEEAQQRARIAGAEHAPEADADVEREQRQDGASEQVGTADERDAGRQRREPAGEPPGDEADAYEPE